MTGKMLRFTSSYREIVSLRDGTEVVLRTVRPGDKDTFSAAFSNLGMESRYLRFFGGKNRLTKADLRYLSEVDGISHVAIVAGVEHPNGDEEGYGVARFIRSAPDVAEFAVVVADQMHRNGLGTLLLKRLAEAASERGITRLTAEFLATNQAIRRTLAHIGRRQEFHPKGTTVEVILSL